MIPGALVLFVNGVRVEDADPDPRTTLAMYLRHKLGLTGTKIGCSEGGCGACVVMVSRACGAGRVSHESVNACLAPLLSLHGAAVTTVEGVGGGAKALHPLQRRLLDAHGSQCGFCTPGFVMAAYALLRRSQGAPSVAQMDEAVQGNLCRCTGYRPILEALHSFAKEQPTTNGTSNGCCGGKAAANGGCCKDAPPDAVEDRLCAELVTLHFYDATQEPIFPPELLVDTQSFICTPILKSAQIASKGTAEAHSWSKGGYTWHRPATLSQLLDLKTRLPDAKLVAGNTEVGVEVKFKAAEYRNLVHVGAVPELRGVRAEEAGVFVGAATDLNSLADGLNDLRGSVKEHKLGVVSSVLEMLHWFAGRHVRSVATVGGNLATASPISDLNPIWLGSGAVVRVASAKGGQRELPVDADFFTGYRRTRMAKEEVIIGLTIPWTQEGEHFAAYKQAQRREDDIAIVNAGLFLCVDGSGVVSGARLAFGGMAATTRLAARTAAAAVGRRLEELSMEGLGRVLVSELELAPGAPGGMERFRLTLALSFLHKFIEGIKNPKISSPPGAERMQATQIFPLAGTTGGPLGRPLAHVSGWKQTKGAAYAHDIPVSGALFGYPVLSPRTCGRIVDVDVSEALAVPSVLAYVDHRDVPATNDLRKNIVKGKTMSNGVFHEFKTGEVVFAKDEVSYFGQMMGFVVAAEEEQAKRAAKKVKVRFANEPRKPIVTIQDAVAASSYFSFGPGPIAFGTVRDSAGRVQALQWPAGGAGVEVADSLFIGGQDHFYLETHGAAVIPHADGEEDEVEIYASTQNPSGIQADVATVLGIRRSQIVVKTRRVGGGFGGKETSQPVIIAAAVAATKLKKPVRVMLERADDMVMTGQRAPFQATYKIALDTDGVIKAYSVNFDSNAGYSMNLTGSVTTCAAANSDAAYNIPRAHATARICKTNLQTQTAMRAFGRPQALIAMEMALEQAATKAGILPEAVRELNLFRAGEETIYHQPIPDDNLRRCWAECRGLADFDARLAAVQDFNRASRWVKRGISMVPLKYGSYYEAPNAFFNQGGALVHIYLDGSVQLNTAAVEMGQGLHTKLAQIAATAFGISLEDVRVMPTSTDKVPNTTATSASLGMDINGPAVQQACDTILERLEPMRKLHPKLGWTELVQKAYKETISLSATGYNALERLEFDNVLNRGQLYTYFTYGTACSEVEVDVLTGDHKLRRVDIVMDIGNSMNPALDIGQIEGAFVQGYGLMMMEELRVRPDGTWLSRGPGVYKIPTADDIPRRFNVKLLGESKGPAVHSSKLLGEPPLLCAASVLMAVKEAVKSARLDGGVSPVFTLHSPATPERIRLACQDHLTQLVPELPPNGTFEPWTVML